MGRVLEKSELPVIIFSACGQEGVIVQALAWAPAPVAGRPVGLTATGYALLHEFLINAGPAMAHGQLLRRVWGEGHSGDAGLVRTVVKRVRAWER